MLPFKSDYWKGISSEKFSKIPVETATFFFSSLIWTFFALIVVKRKTLMHTSMFLFVYVLLTRCLSMRLLTYRNLDATNWIVQHVGVILVHQAIFVRLVILVTCFVTMIRCYSKMGPRRSRTGLLKPTFKTLNWLLQNKGAERERKHDDFTVITSSYLRSSPFSFLFMDKHPQLQFLKADFGKFETIRVGVWHWF